VLHRHDEHVLIVAKLQHLRFEKRPDPHFDRLHDDLCDVPLNLAMTRSFAADAEVDLSQLPLTGCAELLRRYSLMEDDARLERLVPAHDLGEAPLQHGKVKRSPKTSRRSDLSNRMSFIQAVRVPMRELRQTQRHL